MSDYEGYTPGYSSPQFSPYGAPPAFPNHMFGSQDPSQAFFRDIRARESRHEASHGFAMPGGFDLGRFGAMGMVGNMAIGQFMNNSGAQIRPFGGISGDYGSYLNSLTRQAQFQSHFQKEISGNAGLAAFSRLGTNPFFQQAYDMFDLTPGGSVSRAGQMAAGSLGGAFSGNVQAQYEQSQDLVSQMQRRFSTGGTHSYTKSFGMDLGQSVDNMDSYLRYMGSNKGLQRSVDKGLGGDKAASVNEYISMGKQTFGNDMSADQINQLLDSVSGGIEKLDAGKSNTLIAKIQSASKAVNMDGKMFAEYVAMKQNIFKQMGMADLGSANLIIESKVAGKALSQSARDAGLGSALGNEEAATNAILSSKMKFQTSDLANQTNAMGAIMDNMSPAQRAVYAARVRDISNKVNAGDTNGAFAGLADLSRTEAFSSIPAMAAVMNDDLRTKAGRWVNISGANPNARTAREDLISKLNGALTDEQRKALGKNNLGEVLADVGSFTGKNITQALIDKGVDPAMAEKMGADLATAKDKVGGNLNSAEERNQLDADLESSSVHGIANTAEQQKKLQKDADIAKLLNGQMGSMARKLGVKDAIGFATAMIKAGGLSADIEDIKKAASAAGATDLDMNAITEAQALAGGKGEALAEKAQQARQAALEAGLGTDTAEKAGNDVLKDGLGLDEEQWKKFQDEAKAASDQINNSEKNGMKPSETLLQQLVTLLTSIFDWVKAGSIKEVPTSAPTPGGDDFVGPIP